jgi:hypothetical protein
MLKNNTYRGTFNKLSALSWKIAMKTIARIRTGSVRSVLIVYARDDECIYKDTLKHRFERAGIDPFLDVKVGPGKDWQQTLEQAYRSASCAVAILTPDSIKSPWVSYEIGFLDGIRKKIVPYLCTAGMGDKRKKEFTKQIPKWISHIQSSENPDQIIDGVVQILVNNRELSPWVMGNRVQLMLITLELGKVLETLKETLIFGYQIVRFGRWGTHGKPYAGNPHVRFDVPYNSEIDESVVGYERETQRLKIDFIVPIYRKWGTTFKLFVDCKEAGLVKDVQQLLIINGLLEPCQGGSGEEQRIYFLLDKKDKLDVVEEPYKDTTVRNNYATAPIYVSQRVNTKRRLNGQLDKNSTIQPAHPTIHKSSA